MRILGLGVDVVQISAVAGVLARRGRKFPLRVLHPTELAEFDDLTARGTQQALQFLASRFVE